MRILISMILASMCLVGAGFAYSGKAREEEKVSIEEIMKTAMKGGLNKKMISGEASNEEKMQYLGLMLDLLESEPPKGDAAEWKTMAGAVVIDAAKVVAGREGAGDALKASTNCKSCHDKFKPGKDE